MNARLAAIVRRREALVARAGAQRSAVVQTVAGMKRLMKIGDLALSIGRTLRAHPMLTAVATAALMRSPRHRLLLWAGRAFSFWELYRTFRAQWKRNRPGPAPE